MTAKRTYKALTKKQTASVKRYTKQGKSQGVIAKLLGVSKQRVATSQKKTKTGVRRPSPFWKDVKEYKEKSGRSHAYSTKEVMNWKKWGTKRAAKSGKKWKSYDARQARMREIRSEFEGDELREQLEQELEEFQYGDTPR